jgi:FkbM family methyltransferase
VRRAVGHAGHRVARLARQATMTMIDRDAFAHIRRLGAGMRDQVALDVGANTGQSVARIRKAFKDPIIHSFEPSPTTFRLLKERCARYQGVSVWNAAIGAAPGQLTLHENEHSEMSSLLPLGPAGWGRVERSAAVDVMTVDGFAQQHRIPFVLLLKSDTQGFDLEVFKGASRLMEEDRIGLVHTELTMSDLYVGAPHWLDVLRFLYDRNFALVDLCKLRRQRGMLGWMDALLINRRFHESLPPSQ